MRDLLPTDKRRRERILSLIREVYAEHGFDEIETPAMEDSERLHSGMGCLLYTSPSPRDS